MLFSGFIFYMKLLDTRAIQRWKEHFNWKTMTFYLSIDDLFIFGKVIK